VIAWNRAATAMLMDPGSLPPEQRNLLRVMFLDPRARNWHDDWESMARLVVGAFRLDSARAGALEDVATLVNELSRRSPEFEAMWRENDVPGAFSDGIKHMQHPVFGSVSLEYSSFAVDGRPDLILAVYNPASSLDAARIAPLLERRKP